MSARRWSIAIFSARETAAVLTETIAAVERACAGVPSTIDVVVNGDRALATTVAADVAASMSANIAARASANQPDTATALAPASTPRLRVWFVALGDKGHAWNQYIDTIAPEGDTFFFIDGYARVAPDSLRLLDDVLIRDREVWAASAVPSVGRSAKRLRKQMLAEGGLHGNLYALRDSVVAKFRSAGFRLPAAIYRNDSLIGAVVCFSADPGTHGWDQRRLAVVPGATWTNETLPVLRWSSLVTQWKRMQRQAQGALENAAVQQHLARDRLPPEALPRTAAELIERWRTAHPEEAGALLRHPLRRQAARRLAQPRDWSLADRAPELVLLREARAS